ncbi:hypothetical protein CAMGR0001_0738 [Campylobacter gracilis RM3268]|uniref:Uncharacterized protein n=1 Tax=Campylobacter gracilis RM3268 TaxID=553220 RepID=C8PFU5_9BACT|nr:hypothetical protein CAMGR0001_0738 [Campylobacter gracilis RM3268]
MRPIIAPHKIYAAKFHQGLKFNITLALSRQISSSRQVARFSSRGKLSAPPNKSGIKFARAIKPVPRGLGV